MVYELKNTDSVGFLFEGWEETLIWSCLQGIMGKIYVTNIDNPISAMAIIGDFIFYAGKADQELISYKPEWCRQDFIIMVPQNDQWKFLIEHIYGEKAKYALRYAIKKEPEIFDKEKLLQAISTLSPDYELCLIDAELYDMCLAEPWSRDLVSQFQDYDEYAKLGLGVVIRKGNEIVSGASSYTRYREGIEIEIDTKETYRRKGLAYVCGAKLILECLERKLYPSWDAQNKWSVSLAEKLGYHFSHEYEVYEIQGYEGAVYENKKNEFPTEITGHAISKTSISTEPSVCTAESLLQNAAECNPGPWEQHSRYVAESAKKIADKCPDLDSEKAYVYGLLHDIGRKFGVTCLAHVYDGYHYLMAMGYKNAARIALSHSFNLKDIHDYIGKFDIDESAQEELCVLLAEMEFNDYDYLIQLCDAIAKADGIVSLEERMNDVKNRYGYYPQKKWDRNIWLKEYFEEKMHEELYKVVSEG